MGPHALFGLVPCLLWFCFPLSIGLLLHSSNLTEYLLSSYDYIIVGGGVAGLVVANRLSEDFNVTVLVLEAGERDLDATAVNVPGLVGHGFSPLFDWNFTTAPQEALDNRSLPYFQGRTVGGGSIVNGLIMTRGAKADYDAWQELGNPGWGWQGMLPYFMKSENFKTGVNSTVAHDLHINPDMSIHGTSGPVEATYPKFIYNQSANFLHGLSDLGVPLLNDPNAGKSAGAMMVPSSITFINQTREDSATAYLDGAVDRPNLHLATGQTVTRIWIGDKYSIPGIHIPPFGYLRRALGVEIATSGEFIRRNITCDKEVILAAGAVLSPVLLQVSGIGPAPILNDLNISAKINLPGVGQNFQDHGMVHAFYNYTAPGLFTADNLTGPALEQARQEYFINHTGPWTAPLISTVAFPSLSSLAPNWSFILQNISTAPLWEYLPHGPGKHPTLIQGYCRQRELLFGLLNRTDVGALEIMADSIGTLTNAIQHPFSRGSVRALSADILTGGSVAANVALDPRYCAQPEDCEILLAGLRFTGQLVSTTSMRELVPNPPSPWNETIATGPVNETALLQAIRDEVTTEFHPSGTTSMMPIELGGVVSPRLAVYGMANLRVVDAGIIPLIPAAHLQAAVYAIAEKAADIIKREHNGSLLLHQPIPEPLRTCQLLNGTIKGQNYTAPGYFD